MCVCVACIVCGVVWCVACVWCVVCGVCCVCGVCVLCVWGAQKLEPHSTFFDLFDVTCAVRPGLLRDAHLGRAGTGMTVAPRARAAGACWPRAAGPGERLRVSIPLTLSLMSSMSSRSAGSFSVLSTKSSPEPVAVTFRFGRRGRRRGVRRRNGNSTQKREKEID